MSSRTLFRLSGLALMIALPLQILGFVLHPPSEQVVDVLKPVYGPAHLILFFFAWGVLLVALLLVPFLFPDGRFVPRWTRFLVGFLILGAFVALFFR